jgi:hypothetical protein
LLAEIHSKQLLSEIVTKHDCNDESSIQIAIAGGEIVIPHVIGEGINDCVWSATQRATINTHKLKIEPINCPLIMSHTDFDYKKFVQDRGLTSEISMAVDQLVIEELDADTCMKEFEYDASQEFTNLFLDCKVSIDSAIDDNPPANGRKLILPVAAQKAMFTNKKFMSSPHVQHQMDDIMAGKAWKLLGFDTLFMPNRRPGGLSYEERPDGRRLYTCYAVCPGAVHSAEWCEVTMKIGYVSHEERAFIYVQLRVGAKVALPNRIVRFHMLTDVV